MDRRKPVSIATVANATGVSPTTVSHVLSGKRPVSDATVQRVRAAMAELGYVPNHAAQSLASGRTHTVGLLVPDIANPFFGELARGVEDAAERRGYSVILGNTGFDADRESRYLDVIRRRAIDGLVYAAGAPPPQGQLANIARTLPLAMVDEEIPSVRAITVVSDNVKGGELAAECLVRCGHRGALVVTGPPRLQSSIQREEGFRRSFEAAGGHVIRRDGGFREVGAYDVVREMLGDQPNDFTAIFALNDLMAIAALRALREAQVRVPEDVSVIGFDDIAIAAALTPGLTTVHQSIHALGATVAEQLIHLLQNDQPGPPTVSKHVLGVELIERGTVASVSRRATAAAR